MSHLTVITNELSTTTAQKSEELKMVTISNHAIFADYGG